MTLACAWGALAICPPQVANASPMLHLLHTMACEIPKGKFNGVHSGPTNGAQLVGLHPGDILLLHNHDGAYGYWTHAALYVGEGRVVDSNDFRKGTIENNLSMYQDYDELAVFRPEAPPETLQRVAHRALKEIGRPYDPFASLSDSHSQYCSKLIWRSFDAEGVRLCTSRAWVTPDDLAQSPRLHRISDWNNGYKGDAE